MMPWIFFLVGAAGSWLLFWLGSRCAGLEKREHRIIAAAVSASVFALAVAAHFTRLLDYTHAMWRWLGGEDLVALLAALALMGMAWGNLTRRIQRLTVLVMAAVLWLLTLCIAVSPLFWKHGGANRLNKAPDRNGILQQTLSFTCAPAAASMLLHRNGIRATEGELAAASRTSLLFGTSDYALARALERWAGAEGIQVRVMVGSAEESTRLKTPYIAGVNHPKWGSHEVLVESFDPNRVHLIDPFAGKQETYSLKEWAAMWTGRAIALERR